MIAGAPWWILPAALVVLVLGWRWIYLAMFVKQDRTGCSGHNFYSGGSANR